MRLALQLVGLLATPALAAPQTLRMQWLEATNVHLADQGGAINHRRNGKVTVTLAAGGKLTAIEVGSVVDHTLYSSYSTTETTAWSNTWRGWWTLANGGLALELVLGKRTCTREKAQSGVPTEGLVCDTVDQTVAFACTPRTIAVETAAGNRTKVAAWQCSTSGELAEAPTRWTLGTTTCVCTLGGAHDGDSFEPCG